MKSATHHLFIQLGKIFFVFSLLLSLTSCLSPQKSNIENSIDDWKYDDIITLDAIDTEHSNLDLVAVYAKENRLDRSIELRFDILDSNTLDDFDLYVFFDSLPGGSNTSPLDEMVDFSWDQYLFIPAASTADITDSNSHTVEIPHIVNRDIVNDSITIHIDLYDVNDIASPSRIQTFLTESASTHVIDSTQAALINNPEKVSVAPLLIAFWNTMPANTPAQALRRWSGAHTGPLGDRHGLSYIIQAVKVSQLPVILLDLKTPTSVSTLDYLGALPDIQRLQNAGLLILPDISYGDDELSQISLQISTKIALDFGLKSSKMAFTPDMDVAGRYSYSFAEMADRSHIVEWQGMTLLPLPPEAFYTGTEVEQFSRSLTNETADDVSREGLSLQVKTDLLNAALSQDPSDLVTLGGSLPQSVWAHSNVALPVFQYIKRHPWIQVLRADEIELFPTVESESNPLLCIDLLCLPQTEQTHSLNIRGVDHDFAETNQDILKQEIQTLPQNQFSQDAYLTYLDLTSPSTDPNENTLNNIYLSEIYYLIEASRWQKNRYERAGCNSDIDMDGQFECILANQNLFSVIEMDGGRVAYIAYASSDEEYSWITPSSFIARDLNEADDWIFQNDTIYEPSGTYGAFIDSSAPFEMYQTISEDTQTIQLMNQTCSIKKVFQLKDSDLIFDCWIDHAIQMDILLSIDSRNRYTPGWAEKFAGNIQIYPSGIIWGSTPQKVIRVNMQSAKYSINTFLDSYPWITSPEDPNHYYLDGHYLPLSTALITIEASQPFHIELKPVHVTN